MSPFPTAPSCRPTIESREHAGGHRSARTRSDPDSKHLTHLVLVDGSDGAEGHLASQDHSDEGGVLK